MSRIVHDWTIDPCPESDPGQSNCFFITPLAAVFGGGLLATAGATAVEGAVIGGALSAATGGNVIEGALGGAITGGVGSLGAGLLGPAIGAAVPSLAGPWASAIGGGLGGLAGAALGDIATGQKITPLSLAEGAIPSALGGYFGATTPQAPPSAGPIDSSTGLPINAGAATDPIQQAADAALNQPAQVINPLSQAAGDTSGAGGSPVAKAAPTILGMSPGELGLVAAAGTALAGKPKPVTTTPIAANTTNSPLVNTPLLQNGTGSGMTYGPGGANAVNPMAGKSNAAWYTYGEQPAQTFFNNNQLLLGSYVQPGAATQPVTMAAAPAALSSTTGATTPVVAAARGGSINRGALNAGHVHGPGTGTSDSIPTRLSDGEFVIRAKDVTKAGRGSNERGGRKLDRLMRSGALSRLVEAA